MFGLEGFGGFGEGRWGGMRLVLLRKKATVGVFAPLLLCVFRVLGSSWVRVHNFTQCGLEYITDFMYHFESLRLSL